MNDAPRRAPAGDTRRHDADRSRALLLEAARSEFAAKGLSGARVGEIAARAGVNKQLISYYFGGKQGLYDAIIAAWKTEEAAFTGADLPLGELARRYLEAGHRDPERQRLFLRESIDQDVDAVAYEPDAEELTDMRARQAAGEVAAELDPAFVALAMQAIVVAGSTFPGDVKRLMGVEPGSPEYVQRVGEQLQVLARRLA